MSSLYQDCEKTLSQLPQPSAGELQKVQLVDDLESALEACEHPYAQAVSWCNICGATRFGGQWLKPHWRHILVRAVFREMGDG